MQRKVRWKRKSIDLKKGIVWSMLCVWIGSLVLANSSIDVMASDSTKDKLPSGIMYECIGSEIEQFVKEHKASTAGMEVAVFDRKQVIYRNNFGYADVEKKIPMDENTVLDWGAVTKLTVWVSVMQLWEQGKIDLNEDIQT